LTVLFPPGPGGGKEVEHGYKGKGSLLHLVTDKEGKPLWITTTSAKGNERIQALILLDQLQMVECKNIKQMTICEADKGYDSDQLRMEMLKRGYLPIIGYRRNRKERVTTEEIYNRFGISKKRWVVERSFSWLKRKCRRLLMRWERLPEVWDAFALLGLIFMWLNFLLG
jgi:transposase